MLLFLTISIGVIGVAVLINSVDHIEDRAQIMGSFLILLGVFLSLTVVFGSHLLLNDEFVSSKKQIQSLRTDSASEGSFILGTGRVEEKTKYYYFVKLEGNSFVLESTETKNTVLIEDDDREPKILVYKPTSNSRFIDFLFLNLTSRTEIVLPSGSVTEDFTP